MHMFNLDINMRRARPPAFALASLAALALALLAACGDGGDVQIVALTRTPTPEAGPTGPTPIPPPTSITATATPLPSEVLPPRPENPVAGGLLVASYLAGGGANIADCLPEIETSWQLAPTEGERCLFADLDGDGVSELAYALTLAPAGETGPGDVWFFQGADESFRLYSSARVLANAVLEDVAIAATADLTGDRFPELVISARICGAEVCTSRFLIASSHRGSLEDLAPDDLTIANLESVRLEDVSDDGLPDVILQGGTLPTTGAGPPRGSKHVLNWGGLKFFVREQADEPRYLFHAIVDADEAFAATDYEQAGALYQAAVASTALVDWRVESGQGSGRGELVPYALFRAGLAALRTGDDGGALALFGQAADGYGAALHGQAAAIFREAIQARVPPGLACTSVEDFLRPQSARYAEIWDYGFANPQHRISDLCR
jgi:hypothetical protein